jgi:hypothetical protein
MVVLPSKEYKRKQFFFFKKKLLIKVIQVAQQRVRTSVKYRFKMLYSIHGNDDRITTRTKYISLYGAIILYLIYYIEDKRHSKGYIHL